MDASEKQRSEELPTIDVRIKGEPAHEKIYKTYVSLDDESSELEAKLSKLVIINELFLEVQETIDDLDEEEQTVALLDLYLIFQKEYEIDHIITLEEASLLAGIATNVLYFLTEDISYYDKKSFLEQLLIPTYIKRTGEATDFLQYVDLNKQQINFLFKERDNKNLFDMLCKKYNVSFSENNLVAEKLDALLKLEEDPIKFLDIYDIDWFEIIKYGVELINKIYYSDSN